MGDTTTAEIAFGGTLRRCCAGPLLARLAECAMGPDYQATLDDADGLRAYMDAVAAANARTPDRPHRPYFGGNEVNLSEVEAITARCQTLGLAYRLHWDAEHDYTAGNEYWFPGDEVSQETAANEGGDPLIPLYLLRREEWAGKTVADVLAAFAFTTRELPDLVLVDAPGACPGCLTEALLPGSALPEDYPTAGDPEAA